MHAIDKFYINGEWITPAERKTADIINPATAQPCGKVTLGNKDDVDKAVTAARAAFDEYSKSSVEERITLLQALAAAYQARYGDIAAAITEEMGAPPALAMQAQAATGLAQIQSAITALQNKPLSEEKDGFTLRHEPIGVVGLITPWNWPVNQAVCKIAPALAAGCTMVWKPSELAPLSAQILMEIIDAAGVPKGVVNLVHGNGPDVGAAIAGHHDIDMVSFTGSTRAGIDVAARAAQNVKRVAQELGGKSANIILPGADLDAAVRHGVVSCMTNSGQSCNAPTRMLVPHDQMDAVIAIAKPVAESMAPGAGDRAIGPIANEKQYAKVQELIQTGIDEGATLITGGVGQPDGTEDGFFAKPTIFANVSNTMTIAREEVFGPVLCIIPYDDEDDAVSLANDTPYGLTGYVTGPDLKAAAKIGARLRAGSIHLNGAGVNFAAPFGGYKQSGNGREWGEFGLDEYLETKAMLHPGQ